MTDAAYAEYYVVMNLADSQGDRIVHRCADLSMAAHFAEKLSPQLVKDGSYVHIIKGDVVPKLGFHVGPDGKVVKNKD